MRNMTDMRNIRSITGPWQDRLKLVGCIQMFCESNFWFKFQSLRGESGVNNKLCKLDKSLNFIAEQRFISWNKISRIHQTTHALWWSHPSETFKASHFDFLVSSGALYVTMRNYGSTTVSCKCGYWKFEKWKWKKETKNALVLKDIEHHRTP